MTHLPRPPRRPLSPVLLATLLFACTGCSTSDPAGDSASTGASGTGGDHADHAPYAGVAFPSRRTPLTVPPGGLGIVTDSFSDKLSLIDLAKAERTASLPVGLDAVTVDGPVDLALDRQGGWLFVLLTYPDAPSSSKGPHAIHATYDPPGFVQKLSLADLSIVGEVQLDVEPRDLAISDDGARLVALHPFEDQLANAVLDPDNLDWYRGRLAVIDPTTIQPVLSDDPVRLRPCLVPRSVTLSRPDGAFAYVACHGEDAIAVVDLASNPAPIERIAVAKNAGPPGTPAYGPSVIALSPDGSTLAFGNVLTPGIGFLDLASKAVDPEKTPATAGHPVALAYSPDGASLLVVTQAPAAVLRFSATGDELASRVFKGFECETPAAATETPGGPLAVVCSGNGVTPGKVLLLHATTLETLSSIGTGLRPTTLAVLPELAR
jgi:DNA-binding beta-propeller fold protein YncE